MARGGKRTGTPGKAYSNRTDLTPTAAPGQEYGQAKAQLAAQHAVPMAGPGALAPPATPAGPPPGAAPMPAPMQPGELPFAGPSLRPNEAVTAGLPGDSTAPAPPIPAPDVIGAQLRALYQAFPNDDLLRVMALRESQAQS